MMLWCCYHHVIKLRTRECSKFTTNYFNNCQQCKKHFILKRMLFYRHKFRITNLETLFPYWLHWTLIPVYINCYILSVKYGNHLKNNGTYHNQTQNTTCCTTLRTISAIGIGLGPIKFEFIDLRPNGILDFTDPWPKWNWFFIFVC